MKITDTRILKDFSRSFDVRLGQHSDRVERAAAAIRKRWPDIVPDVSEEDGKARLRKMAICEKTNNWEGATRSDILISARVAYGSHWINEERLTPFREFLIEELCVADWPGLLRVMFGVHISSFSPEAAHTYGLAQAIATCRERLGLAEKALLDAVPEILDPRDAPIRIAKRLIEESSPEDALNRWGLKENYDDGLMYLIHQALIGCFKPLLAKGDKNELTRFLGWLRPKGGMSRQLGAGMAIDAVLEPWISRIPSPEYQAFLISGLVATYGDPRIQRSAAWDEASEASTDLFRRWLTGETMLIFLNAISSTNDEAMWKPRRKFWMGLYESGAIDEAWVAFSREAYRAAQRMANSEDEEKLYSGFGHQTARGGRQNTSLLIMRIGTRVIVEGSHSYKVQLFERSNPKTPELYKKSYDCERIRLTSDEDKVHVDGSWQRWVRQKVQ